MIWLRIKTFKEKFLVCRHRLSVQILWVLYKYLLWG